MADESRFYIQLPLERREEIDSLLLELKECNSVNRGKRKLRRDEIVPLPPGKSEKLWNHIMYCAGLASNWSNVRSAISAIATKTSRTFKEVQDECRLSIAIHIYTYVWRHYEHSEDLGIMFKTAEYGYKSWICEQNAYCFGVEYEKDRQEEALNRFGHKISNVNLPN